MTTTETPAAPPATETAPTTASGDPDDLTTGWEPDLDLDDTLVRHYVFALAASNLAPARALDGRVLERADVIAADLGVPNAIFNAAVLTRPPAPGGWDATLATVESFYREGAGRVYLWSPWPTPDLRDRGWELEGHPPLLIRPAGLPLPPAPQQLEIRPVVGRTTLDAFKHVLVDGFPLDEHQPFDPDAWLDERILDVPGHELYVGYLDGRAVASGWLYLHAGLGVLVLGATLPDARMRGCWRGLLRRRLERAEGCVVASVFGDMSRPGAERHGFLPVSRFTVWHRERAA